MGRGIEDKTIDLNATIGESNRNWQRRIEMACFLLCKLILALGEMHSALLLYQFQIIIIPLSPQLVFWFCSGGLSVSCNRHTLDQ